MQKCTINGQSAVLNLTNEQLQVLVSGKFGDGSLNTPRSEKSNATFSTNCIYEEYLKFKKHLLGDLSFNITPEINRGYKENIIYRLSTKASEDITKIRNMSIEEALKLIDDLGVALWFYDDGSLHKTKLFYNLNTQAFSEEVNRDIFVPFFKKFNINVIPTIERKKNGKEYWYLRIPKYEGAYEVSQILSKYSLDCYSYKIWDSETIQKWSKLQAQLKSVPLDIKDIHPRTLSSLLDKELSNEDIVRTLTKVKERMKKRHSRN
jgi:hypothetical protein